MRRSLSFLQAQKPRVTWLNVQKAGWSVLERLAFEECLFRTEAEERRHWILVGAHQATHHKHLPNNDKNSTVNACIVMGIGGKPHQLLDVESVQRDDIHVLKRFSGGGTVILDSNSLWTTIIGRNAKDKNNNKPLLKEHFPRPIMEYTADALFGPTFDKLTERSRQRQAPRRPPSLVVQSKSCGVADLSMTNNNNNVKAYPSFHLRENDYCLGDYKMGGNAQSIGKDGFLHHTSFLWDFQPSNMDYLQLPAKRPKYRGDRSHDDFLVRLNRVYQTLTPDDFVECFRETCADAFELHEATVADAMTIIDAQGGLQKWLATKSRTKVVTEF